MHFPLFRNSFCSWPGHTNLSEMCFGSLEALDYANDMNELADFSRNLKSRHIYELPIVKIVERRWTRCKQFFVLELWRLVQPKFLRVKFRSAALFLRWRLRHCRWPNCVIRLPMFLSLPPRRRIRDPSQSVDVKGNRNFFTFLSWKSYCIFMSVIILQSSVKWK